MKTYLVLLLLPLLAACAAKPTHILVDPAVNAVSRNMGNNVAVNVTVSGDPAMSVLREKQHRFPLQRPVADATREKLVRELQAMGFRIDPYASRQLDVQIITAEHTITDHTLKDEISASVVMQFSATTEFGNLTRKFSDNRMQEVGIDANLGEASAVLNQSVGHVLGRALNDPELLQFLTRQN